ncbi:MAG: trypsin-like serine protease [Gammaproteobacteria bacterium]
MTIELVDALSKVKEAAGVLIDADKTIRSVGVGRAADGYGFQAVRNVKAAVPLASGTGAKKIPRDIAGIPVHFINSSRDPASLARVPHSGPASPGVGSLIPEQQFHRPLMCGLQIQNFDDDVRTGEIARGFIIIGTLGCFVQRDSGQIAILTNNHVAAGENRGVIGADRIQQPGGSTFVAAMEVGELSQFVRLVDSPPGATIVAGTVVLNEVDGALVDLSAGTAHIQNYLPSRTVTSPRGVAAASVGDKVHKVGRTTGLTFGTVTQVGAVVGPVPYAPGDVWFQQCLVVEGDNGTTFSDHGDSGSAIVRDDGMLVGLLFAGNGSQTYACAIDNVMRQLDCQLA